MKKPHKTSYLWKVALLSFAVATPLNAHAQARLLARLATDVAAASIEERVLVVHFTRSKNVHKIMESEMLVGRNGIFAIDPQANLIAKVMNFPQSDRLRNIITLVPGNLQGEIPITGQAAEAFRSPIPWGPFSFYRWCMGHKSTPPGIVHLGTMTFERSMDATYWEIAKYWMHKGTLDFGIDALIWSAYVILDGETHHPDKLRGHRQRALETHDNLDEQDKCVKPGQITSEPTVKFILTSVSQNGHELFRLTSTKGDGTP